MPSLSTDVVVAEHDDAPVRPAVEEIFSKAKKLRFSPPVSVSESERVVDLGSVALEDVGKVVCSYAVAGAWNVGAKCEIASDDGKEMGWLGWVFDYVPHGSDEGAEAPARFSFCFSPELYKMGKVSMSYEDVADEFDRKAKSAASKYVCIEGWVDNPDYFVARSGKSIAGMASAVDKHLSELGLYGGTR